MKQIAYTNARQNLVDVMEEVNDSHEPVEITRRGKRSVVILAYEDYKAIEMTAQMMKDPEQVRDMLLATLEDTVKKTGNP